MDLFNQNTDTNILPYDGEVIYYGAIMNYEKAQKYYDYLLNNIEWRNDQTIIFDKLITTKRKVAWYGDKEFEYSYSNTTKHALKWTPELFRTKSSH